MPVIDADTHVDESESTWSELEGGPCAKYIPATMTLASDEASRAGLHARNTRFWLVDGQLQNRPVRDDAHHPPRAMRELDDIAGRLRQMDQMGVDIQVIFPTFFIRYSPSNPEAEFALATTYNRWLAEKCAVANGRLRWAAVLPWLSPGPAAEELGWAHAHGACGIFRRSFDGGRPLNDPSFFPVYEEASALDMPICIHTGHPGPDPGGDRGVPIMAAFGALVKGGLAGKFPRLRFGLIEAGASWIPYSVSQLEAQDRTALLRDTIRRPAPGLELASDLFHANRLYVTVDSADDVAYLLRYGTVDSFMVGTDYSHSDISANSSALADVEQWALEGKISKAVARKILRENPQTFYGIA